MTVKEAVLAALKEVILPELQIIKTEQAELKMGLALTNKRLDDVNGHLIDQSRRIDEVNKRFDEVNKRFDEVNKRIDETNKRIDETNKRIDENNARLDRLYEVVVRREEHHDLAFRVTHLEKELAEIHKKLAA